MIQVAPYLGGLAAILALAGRRTLEQSSAFECRALWRETLVDVAIFREWIVNMWVRPAAARMAHLLAELRQQMAAVGLSNGEEFEFPVTQSELGEALGLSTVHVNRVLQASRAERVLDLQKNFVTIEDL